MVLLVVVVMVVLLVLVTNYDIQNFTYPHHIYTYIHAYIHTRIHTRTHGYIYIYIYIYIYTHILSKLHYAFNPSQGDDPKAFRWLTLISGVTKGREWIAIMKGS